MITLTREEAQPDLAFESVKKFFDVVVSYFEDADTKILHNLRCEPYVIIVRLDGGGWFGWKADCLGQSVVIDSKIGGRQEFPYMPFKKVTDKELVLDASSFKGASYFYLFAEEGFQKVKNHINQEKNT